MTETLLIISLMLNIVGGVLLAKATMDYKEMFETLTIQHEVIERAAPYLVMLEKCISEQEAKK